LRRLVPDAPTSLRVGTLRRLVPDAPTSLRRQG